METIDKAIGLVFLFICLAVGVGIFYELNYTVKVCIDEAVVVDILELQHRDATIEVDDGRVISVNQATLKKGEPYCLASKRVSEEEYKQFYY